MHKTVNDNGTYRRRRLFCEKQKIERILIENFFALSVREHRRIKAKGSEKMVGRVGFEPTTGRLKAECSTTELTPHQGVGWSGRHPKNGGIIPQNRQITSAFWSLFNNKRLLALACNEG
jgi:hypothetical protein